MRIIHSAALTLLAVRLVSIDASAVSADIVKYTISGTIDENNDASLYPGISPGDPFSGFFAYDDSIAGTKNPGFGLYQFHHTSNLLGVSMTVGEQAFQGNPSEGYSPQLYDDFFGMDSIVYRQTAVPLGGHEATDFIVQAEFVAPTTLLSIPDGATVYLPSTMELGDWTTKKEVKFGVSTLTGVEQFLSGTINSIQLMTDANGDYNMDGVVDADDVDLQAAAIKDPSPDLALYDENRDGLVDYDDRLIWIHNHAITWIGDSNLDHEFTSDDLLSVFQAETYRSGEMATWVEGDWDGNMLFESNDLVAAFADNGFRQGPRQPPVPVPEPSAMVLCLMSLVSSFRWRSRGRLD